MAGPAKIQTSFTGGEIAPQLYGRVDLAKWSNGASVMRNMQVSYRGGASSRAGLRYVGTCLQDAGEFGTNPPPRDIRFQFNINQGYALEFGDQTVTRTVTDTADNGGEVQLELDSTRGLMTGNSMVVSGVTGTTEANGTWSIVVDDATHVTLTGSVYANAYVSGGTTVTQSGYMRIKSAGAYVVEDPTNISAITTANPLVITSNAHGYQNGDWVYISGVGGMTELNGLTWVVEEVTANTYQLVDLFGNSVSSLGFGAYTSGGTAERIYTVVSPYAAEDLPFLKYTQSADTMSLCCWNQDTFTEYPPYDLVRNGATDWVFNEVDFGSSITAPTGVTATHHNSTTQSTYYSYVVTAIDSQTGEESVASSSASAYNNDIAVNAGSNTIKWNAVAGASSYNIYKATPSYAVAVPVGASYGYIGTAFGTEFTDTNILADFSAVPPVYNNPFARGKIEYVTITGGGSGYTQAGVTYSVATSTGSGFTGTPIVISGAVVGFIITNGGEGYAPGDTISFPADGTGATATLDIGPQEGTYPGCVAYYQQRRVYANTQNQPDTYFFSQPGAYTNMDISIPVTDDMAIIGTPWAQQVNGIQAMQPMTNGLIMLTGNGAWNLNGGGNNEPITPSSQNATSQAYNGCHDSIPPIVVNYDILYVQSKGSIIRDLAYNFFTNVFTGTDMTVLSSHLFNYHQLTEWDYAEEPYKIIWATRDDGILLSLTYLKEQDVYSWARHDTNGFFVNVCTVTEPPVDAVYVITKRYINGQWKYYSERMDNRNWETAEDCFCVDAGLSTGLTYPDATLFPAAAEGTGNISDTYIIQGGDNYTSPVIVATSPDGLGTGATFSIGLTGGAITSVTVTNEGTGYAGGTTLTVQDTTGSGAIIAPVITNNVTFTTDTNIFSADNEGDVIRIGNNNASADADGVTVSGGGKAVITSYVSPTEVVANIIEPITAVLYDNPSDMPVPCISGQWSLAPQVTNISGLNHLEGMEVSILADGSVVENQTVTNGGITLAQPASLVTVGLPYTCQLQTLYLSADTDGALQGRRKNINQVVVRTENSRGFTVGTDQPIQAATPDNANIPWENMKPVKERAASIEAGNSIPLYTGDSVISVPGQWSEYGTVAIQQEYPLPLNVLAVVIFFVPGDA